TAVRGATGAIPATCGAASSTTPAASRNCATRCHSDRASAATSTTSSTPCATSASRKPPCAKSSATTPPSSPPGKTSNTPPAPARGAAGAPGRGIVRDHAASVAALAGLELAHRAGDGQRDGLAARVTPSASEEYRPLIEEYFRRLSE